MQALASKASTTFGVALGLMLTLLGGLALLGFGLYLAAQRLLAGIYDIQGKDVTTLLFAVLIVTTVVALICAFIAACVRLGFWLYGVFGRTHATIVADYEDPRLARVDAAGVTPLPRMLLENPRFAAALLALAHTAIETRKPPQVPQTFTYAPHLRYSNDVQGAIADELTGVLGRISQETRKVGVFCLAIGQQFSSEVMSTAVRNSFVSYLSCRTRRDVARIMSGSTTFAKAAETLTTGQAVWLTPAGDFHRLAVPNTTKQHIHQVAQTLTPHTPASPSPAATPLPTAETHLPAAAEPVGNPFDPRTARVRQLILENKSAKEIIGEVWGTNSGDSYRKASAAYQAIVRQLVRTTR